ncbi:MAG: HAMP domain-containing histidine kinase [Clostridiales bacterium]|nr:HAMP domain-containing histidine kinase [Clostridiales bacterium]
MKQKKLTCALWAKTLAFVLAVLCTVLTAGCALGVVGLIEGKFYTRGPEHIRQETLAGLAGDTAWETFLSPETAALRCQRTNQTVNVYDGAGTWLSGSGEPLQPLPAEDDGQLCLPETDGQQTVFWYLYCRTEDHGISGGNVIRNTEQLRQSLQEAREWTQRLGSVATPGDPDQASEPAEPEIRLISVALRPGLPEHDLYRLVDAGVRFAYAMRYGVYAVGLIALLLAVACFVFLMSAAGHRPGEETMTPRGLSRVPFDLFTAAVAAVLVLGVCLVDELSGTVLVAVGAGVYVLAAASICLGWCISAAVRFKTGTWWRNTVIWRILHLLWRGLRAVGRGMGRFFQGLPLVKRTVLILLGVTAAELVLLVLCAAGGSWGALVVLWVVEKLVLLPAAVFLALGLRRLQAGALALAEGDLSHQIDLTHLRGGLKEHAEHLNCIAAGMSRAVDARMKSERMKTELITNVSHDIKTPLTSIINYTDLIARQPSENEQTREYAEVLLRQSERLKKLLEDLVEASRAASGSMEILLAPCEVGVLLSQAIGEYEPRLAAQRLELVLSQPEEPVRILADGRRMWRVFDNLLGNICKYAMPGTRVYLDVTRAGGEVTIAFKNTSRDRLNITADELMERFVRGDASRASEGSGLGLSIARSLVQLQGGSLELVIDGDLFKAALRFREAA